ncbi:MULTISPECIES: hypothetical protein [unclassified Bradyrhizobium]|uniref:hypothetical protein n=1 Tax=unclassified Bradyrhizobium TaxID=2631580 RepID=UPI00247AB3EF|nr:MULTISPECIES: hypothetical protein [unclassified Bradyrhizobium]WGS17724.1 hypothetical protein MTX22_24195 [Bradyrhizobium sp. ISRA463]WGS24518.1 hypothetical protein MTX19_21860 [Bradyrhizobium sp. ISRA464]
MPRPSLTLSLAFLLAAPGLSLAADDIKPAAPDSTVAANRVACSLHRNAEEPADPSSTSAIPEKFVAREHFAEDFSSSAAVKISWLGATFARRFATKVEDDVGGTSLQTYVLSAASSDKEILAKLDQDHESRLADVWCLLKQQPNGSSGPLETNAKPNVFYVRDMAGELGAVDVLWGGVGWEIGASPVGDTPRWSAGTRIFSR